MSTIRISTLLAAALLLVPIASARADDSLLSGYGGPGGGEQVVLGSKLLPPKKGNGSIRSSGPVGPASASAPTTTGSSATLPRLSTTPSGSSTQAASGRRGHRTGSTDSSTQSRLPSVTTGSPTTILPATHVTTPTYPASARARSGGAGSLLGGGDLLLVALGAALLGVTVAGTRRLVVGGSPDVA